MPTHRNGETSYRSSALRGLMWIGTPRSRSVSPNGLQPSAAAFSERTARARLLKEIKDTPKARDKPAKSVLNVGHMSDRSPNEVEKARVMSGPSTGAIAMAPTTTATLSFASPIAATRGQQQKGSDAGITSVRSLGATDQILP